MYAHRQSKVRHRHKDLREAERTEARKVNGRVKKLNASTNALGFKMKAFDPRRKLTNDGKEMTPGPNQIEMACHITRPATHAMEILRNIQFDERVI